MCAKGGCFYLANGLGLVLIARLERGVARPLRVKHAEVAVRTQHTPVVVLEIGHAPRQIELCVEITTRRLQQQCEYMSINGLHTIFSTSIKITHAHVA